MTPASILAILQAGKFALETAELWAQGDLTEEQADARLELMVSQLNAANAAWEGAANGEA